MRNSALLIVALFLGANSIHAQSDIPFTSGSVYELRMIRTDAHSQNDYLTRLNAFYMPVMRKAQEEGLIKSFKVLSGLWANEDDFDILLMVEHASMAIMDPDPVREAKWEAIEKEMINAMGGPDKRKAFTSGLDQIRHYKGNKIMRDMVPK